MSEHLPTLTHSEVIYEGKVFRIRKDDLAADDHGPIHREVIVHPHCVCGVAVMDDGRLILVRQYRHPTGGFLWEVPAGKIDPGETPEEAFRRELIEECGVGCDSAEELLSFYTSPGILTERMHLFLARGCKEGAGEQNPGEIAEWKAVTREEAERMIESGEIADAKSIIAIRSAPR
jgi:ADP-ribose pyrophosphatase